MVHHERLVAQVFDRDLRSGYEGMPGRADNDHLVDVHLGPLQLVKRRLVFYEADVDFTVHHLPGNLVQPAAIDSDLYIGIPMEVRTERGRQKVHGGGLMGGNAKGARLHRVDLADMPHRFVAQVHHPPGVVGEDLTGRRQ
jgi:hypothetical protein